jgi:hypothetical protein
LWDGTRTLVIAMYRHLTWFTAFILLILAFQPAPAVEAAACLGRFIEHELPHTTAIRGLPRSYESNGSGVAINDLNQDGWLDIVLGNLYGPSTILWNQGGLRFRAEPFAPTGQTRAVALVDVDGDGWIDIVQTTQLAAPRWWRNNGDMTFSPATLRGIRSPAYTLLWFDPDGDGDLDVVTASYDSELERTLRDSFMLGGGAGVIYYERQDDRFQATRLADQSQALALAAIDINGDGALDLLVGNDFGFPDQSWSYQDGVWAESAPFVNTAYNTMSFDYGDLNNDGALEFFAADMLPYPGSPVADLMIERVINPIAAKPRRPDDRQLISNVLLQRDSAGQWVDVAEYYGVVASGWSWSSKFGDLDNDGYLDLYVVNGMMSVELFPDLPGNELVEANQAYHNQGGTHFEPAPEWGLGSLRSGRGMSMGDLDNDGDLDIVVNNLSAPAQLFENALCGGASLQVELRAPGTGNTYGLGATLLLETSAGRYWRDVRSGSGYISGDPSRVHFGFPRETQLRRLEVRWADGAVSVIDQFGSEPLLTLYHP